MASLMNKVMQFANSPKGKQVIRQATDKAQQLAKDPKTRAKFDKVANSPKGRQVIRQATDKAQQLASDPKTLAKIQDVRRRVQGGRGGSGTGSGTSA
ncbi:MULTISPECIES: hypothetical protein [Modestobacter]|uniref:hypothetical protein n=1 Tax=Modestobacter TaxID=88138 RepID=UPI00056CCE94|nr:MULTISPECIES: hypothetical protein [Modestobacter]MCZ2823901.1 hypothetical protein [Modestobacter sp. VKM Ac-2981]MCZ2852146.1 hypothetical protein [Modestobacter sp. VKM Ac-2982]